MIFNQTDYAKEYELTLEDGSIDIVELGSFFVIFCPYDDEMPIEQLGCFDSQQEAIEFKSFVE